MAVPFIDLKRTVSRISDKVQGDWSKCLAETQFVGGEFVKQLETKLKDRLGVNHAITCANGTDALIIGLQALGVGRGHRVAIPDMTFWATYEAVVLVGAEPVLIDIDRDDLQMNFEEFRTAHERFRFDAAILPHLFGWTSKRLDDFRQFCTEKKIPLLEDGAQSFGVKVRGKDVLAEAQFGTISFYPAKVLGGAMDGGAVTAREAKHADLFRVLANHGRATHYSYSHVGWNSRMGGLQAAFLLRALDVVDEAIASRNAGLAIYRKFVEENFKGQVRLYEPGPGVHGNGYLSVMLLPDGIAGETVVGKLKEHGVGAARTYPEPMHKQVTSHRDLRASDLRNSIWFCQHVVNLPLFGFITEAECLESAKALQSVLSGLRRGGA